MELSHRLSVYNSKDNDEQEKWFLKTRNFCVMLFFIAISGVAFAQKAKVVMLHSGSGISLRGLSVVDKRVVWVSGNRGTVGKSVDGGQSWQWMQVPGHEKRDFRDIEAFNRETAIIMAVGEPALILKTVDGGARWKKVYTNDIPGMFLDAMEFWNEESGIVVGDPIAGRFFIARTFDGGSNWRAITFDRLPVAESGEACFAASGTNIRALKRDEACFVTGGKRSRLFYRGSTVNLPMHQGVESAGANSLAVWRRSRRRSIIAVAGGDFANDTSTHRNFALSFDEGATWSNPEVPPTGYRSCVEFVSRRKLVTCGISGVDVSEDSGRKWQKVSTTGFHVCRKAKKGKVVYLAGADGRIARISLL